MIILRVFREVLEHNQSRSHCFQVQLVTCCDLFVYHLKKFGVSMPSAHTAASRPFGKCWFFVELMVMVMVSVSGEILEHNRSRSYYFQVQAVTFCDFLGYNVENFDDAMLSSFFRSCSI
jgi:hypothetical protein